MKSFLIIAALLASGAVHAGTGVASITAAAPTTYLDGSPLKASDISGYVIECTFTPTGGTAAPCTLASNTITGSTPTGAATLTYPPAGGKACFQLRTVANAVQGPPSALIAASCRDLAPLVPGATGPVTVTITVAVQTP